MDQPFVIGRIHTSSGEMPLVRTRPVLSDRLGTVKARLTIGRMNYKVHPGLYGVNSPRPDSPVFVTANYKMSFDALRFSLSGTDGWILVLDTNGINVWCAAGKGTFGTEELKSRIESTGLANVVSHRTLIVPQLGAPGIAAHSVKRRSGFRVLYGPVRAKDIPRFMASGLKADPTMRRKTFTLWERAELIPAELVLGVKSAAVIVPLLSVFGALLGPGPFVEGLIGRAEILGAVAAIALTAGGALTPLLLPALPGHAFSAKAVTPFLIILTFWALWADRWVVIGPGSVLEFLGASLMGLAAATYLSMNFTGASTYTSLSGVRREMRTAVPCQVMCAGLGLWVWMGAFWLTGGVCGP
jgi:acetyl-CoA decarbonylase/synthase complex subunit gamma